MLVLHRVSLCSRGFAIPWAACCKFETGCRVLGFSLLTRSEHFHILLPGLQWIIVPIMLLPLLHVHLGKVPGPFLYVLLGRC